ncbi:hypothetical protein GCM10011519_01650 [Marmoricola endophyticus]|uniref:Hydrogenobyrinate a,c-diamide synthase n=1 Tax=Marmoricola endophyticus TaxID=2040280 RepID=A0A917EXR9_9ACTN|nr:cobyrinate a,c-diamide synthase [Marmoricola endophyticus]GGF31946.1 hypothetical protein GCM10011519_01650 [Marmoricola endophyticus]
MTTLPRLVVAAPSTGSGKTTVATGLMAALTRAGHVVSGHKVGPDYIDPGYHALACGRSGRNLDPHLVGEDRIAPLLLHGAHTPTPADVAVVEGVMGLYDGRVGGAGFSSTAHVAHLTASPVLLVVDVSRSSRSVGAVAHGMASYPGAPRIGGVVLNQVGSPRLEAEVRTAIETAGLPVLGVLPRDEAFSTPSRHLGLVPAAEREEAAHALDHLAAAVAEHVDLDAVLALARSAPDLDVQPWDPTVEVAPTGTERPVVAVAGGRAFTFRYAETEELLEAAGCRVVTFDPTTDRSLPEGTRGIYLGGGFPEVHASALADNRALLGELRAAVAAGVPTVAECAGLLYLADTLDGTAMVGALRAEAAMTGRLTLRYPEATASGDSMLGRSGETVTGHEFHRTHTEPVAGTSSDLGPAWRIDGADVGFAGPALHASYLHVHWAGHPQLAQRFADAVHAHRPAPEPTRRRVHATPRAAGDASRTTDEPPADPLRHHGDAEVRAADGPVLDLAVNVHPGPRPPWLEAALRTSLDEVGAYPHPGTAEAAVAARHGRERDEVLATAGAAEAFGLIARLREWRRPVVVHPQFTEPHAALQQAGHAVTEARLSAPFVLDDDAVPEDADLVVVGNPTNPTGVLHPAEAITALLRPGRLVVVDEAFLDAVPGERESLAATSYDGLVVLRSLTKLWGMPGVRAGYALGQSAVVDALRREQTPWSVSAQACAALVATTSEAARTEAHRRAQQIARWRAYLETGLADLGLGHVPSTAPYVLAELGDGVHERLRRAGIAVRRCDTFPGLGPAWVRIAVRPETTTDRLLHALEELP